MVKEPIGELKRQQLESKSLTVYRADIRSIGHTVHKVNGNACFACDGKTCNIERILLREVLSLYGRQITDALDDPLGKVAYLTDMPWDEYMAHKN